MSVNERVLAVRWGWLWTKVKGAIDSTSCLGEWAGAASGCAPAHSVQVTATPPERAASPGWGDLGGPDEQPASGAVERGTWSRATGNRAEQFSRALQTPDVDGADGEISMVCGDACSAAKDKTEHLPR